MVLYLKQKEKHEILQVLLKLNLSVNRNRVKLMMFMKNCKKKYKGAYSPEQLGVGLIWYD